MRLVWFRVEIPWTRKLFSKPRDQRGLPATLPCQVASVRPSAKGSVVFLVVK